jgi:hypothetical protein
MTIENTEPQWLFVLSSERSGSTLLTRMLAQNEGFVVPPELWFLRYEGFDEWKAQKPEAFASLKVLGQHMNPAQPVDSLEKELQGMPSLKVYAKLARHCGPQRVIVDKTPGYANELPVLRKSLNLNAKYIWLIRHPLGVIDSEMRHAEGRDTAGGLAKVLQDLKSSVQKCLDSGMTRRARRREAKWRLQNHNIEQFLGEVPCGNQARLRFEELLGSPVKSLQNVCDQLNLVYDPKMENPFQTDIEITAGIGNPNFNKRSRLDPSLADEWRARYAVPQLESSTVQQMVKYGFAEEAGRG